MELRLQVNGRERRVEASPTARLSTVLREGLGLTGVKEGCCEGECGACTILIDGEPVVSCLMLAMQAEGRAITTIEGIEAPGLQDAFLAAGAVQCGYCTPGMIVAAEGLLRSTPAPSRNEIRHALAGNLCRCTGFETIVDAVALEAERRQGEQA